jgi:hypothetical protein
MFVCSFWRPHEAPAGEAGVLAPFTPAMKCHPGACPRLLILIVPASPATPFESVAVLGVVVVIRIALNFSLDVEIDGAWPWRRRQVDARVDREALDTE